MRIVATCAAVGLVACGGGSTTNHGTTTASSPSSGIDLVTVAQPTCPVQQVGQVCERPISARVRILHNGALLVTVQTGLDGTAHVPLPPGIYGVAGQSGSNGLPRAPQPTQETVVAGRFLTVRVVYDTAIR